MPTPSRYQTDIFSFIKNSDKSLLIQALAGSGKSTTIVAASKIIPKDKKTIFVAFNKSIATDLAKKLPSNVDASTLHSVGLSAWKTHCGKIEIEPNKIYNIIENVIGKTFPPSVKFKIKVLISLLKNHGVVPKGLKKATPILELTNKTMSTIMSHYGISFNPPSMKGLTQREKDELNKEFEVELFSYIEKILKVNIKNQTILDFDDMLYFPAIFSNRIEFDKYDVAFVDEAQDVSEIQQILIQNILHETSRLIAVGDKNQSIYGFRGASVTSLDEIKEKFKCEELPLSICYRCSKNIIAEAQKIVPEIEVLDTAIKGTVCEHGDYKNCMTSFQPHDYIICRNVSPLIKLAFEFLANSKPCYIMGDDIGAGIKTLIKSLRASCIPELKQKLREWREREKRRILDVDPDANVGFIEDKADSVLTFIAYSGAHTIDSVLSTIDTLFNKKIKDAIVLSTIHKSKGLEAERVFILDKQLMPSKFATKEWQKAQEENLKYVAITRAKSYLGYINTPKESK